MMGSMELKPAERNTETMKDVERNLSKESCREKPIEREIAARKRERDKTKPVPFCVYTRYAHRTKPDRTPTRSTTTVILTSNSYAALARTSVH